MTPEKRIKTENAKNDPLRLLIYDVQGGTSPLRTVCIGNGEDQNLDDLVRGSIESAQRIIDGQDGVSRWVPEKDKFRRIREVTNINAHWRQLEMRKKLVLTGELILPVEIKKDSAGNPIELVVREFNSPDEKNHWEKVLKG